MKIFFKFRNQQFDGLLIHGESLQHIDESIRDQYMLQQVQW